MALPPNVKDEIEHPRDPALRLWRKELIVIAIVLIAALVFAVVGGFGRDGRVNPKSPIDPAVPHENGRPA